MSWPQGGLQRCLDCGAARRYRLGAAQQGEWTAELLNCRTAEFMQELLREMDKGWAGDGVIRVRLERSCELKALSLEPGRERFR